jgi:hypothetical protein
MKMNEQMSESIGYLASLFKSMTADMSEEELHWQPPGTAHSVAATYAHAALATDWQLHSVLQGDQPWYEGEWAARNGVNIVQPQQTAEWAKDVRVDRETFGPYAEAVFADMLAYCQGLSDEDMERTIDMSKMGFGEPTVGWFMSHLVVIHLSQLAGEISAIKGSQGLEGYGF